MGDLCSAFGFPTPDLQNVRCVVSSVTFPTMFQTYLGVRFSADSTPGDIQVVRHLQCLRSILALFSDAHLDGLRCALCKYSDLQKAVLLHQLSHFFGAIELAHLAPLCGSGISPSELNERFRIDRHQPLLSCVLSELLIRCSPESFLFLQRSLPSLTDGEKIMLVPLLSCELHLWGRFRNTFFSGDRERSSISQPIKVELEEEEEEPNRLSRPSAAADAVPALQSQQGDSKLGFSISLLEFPNTKKSVVSKKALPAPRPSLMLKGDDSGFRSQLFVVPVLANYDTGELLANQLLGAKALPIVTGKKITFNALKIIKTSIQLGNIRPCIQFELRRYDRDSNQKGPFDLLHWVRSEPMHVVSHSTLCKIAPPTGSSAVPSSSSSLLQFEQPAPMSLGRQSPSSMVVSLSPTLTDVIPETADWRGGTRIAILGENFVDNPSKARVRFGSTQVVPEILGPRTLICFAPRHPLGQVPMSVSFDGENWTLDRPFYFTESAPVLEEVQNVMNSSCPSLDLENIDEFFDF
uniref:IPT/TIG domain-containing protein n=1 Tax=Paramoeba aestuarina TaxID=180227 RepID=A0A7S4P0S2_9EUKA